MSAACVTKRWAAISLVVQSTLPAANPLTTTVGRHDRNVGGRQAQAPRPPQPDSDMSEADEGAGGVKPEDELEAGPPETGCYPIISNSCPNRIHT